MKYKARKTTPDPRQYTSIYIYIHIGFWQRDLPKPMVDDDKSLRC